MSPDAFFDPSAFTLGMVALLNPCGFALLPAYLGFFLGLDDNRSGAGSTLVALNRGQIVGLSMSAGFLAVFGVLGLFLAGSLTAIGQSGWLPRLTIVIGVGLVVLGVAMLRGFQPALSLPKLNKGGNDQSIVSMFVFGVSYAIASLSCTIGIFITIVANTTRSEGFGERLGSFLSYAIGMGLLATVVTLAVGFGKKGLVNNFRRLLPKINLFSAIILVVVGVYVTLYGIWSQQVFGDPGSVTPWIDSIVLTVEGWQGALTSWMAGRVNPFGLVGEPLARTTIMGWSFLIINVIVAVAGFLARRNAAAHPAATDTAADTARTERVGS
ncbi:MAG: cytochrome c biogenesis CcdA family protein [Acidimicrobiia bacterium]|nr:cytochrome c biogenesis CcdA family protein [Acidimicrobiia bacterium]